MGRARPLAAAVLIACLLCAPVGAGTSFRSRRRPPVPKRWDGPDGCSKSCRRHPQARRRPYRPEKLAGKALYLTATLGGRATQMLIDVSDTPKLSGDTDGDGDLAEEQAVSGKRLGSRGLLDSLFGSADSRQNLLQFSSREGGGRTGGGEDIAVRAGGGRVHGTHPGDSPRRHGEAGRPLLPRQDRRRGPR